MKGSVVFCHGLESGPWGRKIRVLAEAARQAGYSVESPDFQGMRDPAERIRKLLDVAHGMPKPLILAGSSMGGYVATIASATLQPRGLFLLAPAFYLPGYPDQDPRPEALHIEIVHAWGDRLVPAENSFRFARTYGAELHYIEGTHRLTERIPFLESSFLLFLTRVQLMLRFAGCMAGQALADALGMWVEGSLPAESEAFVRDVIRAGKVESLPAKIFPFGQYTDDTQLARELLQSLIERGQVDPEDFARRLVTLYREDGIVGIGTATRDAIRKLQKGIPWSQAGSPAPRAGNGAAMRAAPIGLAYRGKLKRLKEAAELQSHVTHLDPRSVAGAVAIATAVSLALEGNPIVPAAFCEGIAGTCESLDPVLAGALRRLPAWLDTDPKDAASIVGLTAFEDDGQGFRGIPGFVTGSVLWSLYCFLKYPDNYLDAVCTAISAGGDTDTTAAMTGAISGARLGLDAIPSDLVAFVNDRGKWTAGDLARLARKATLMEFE
jgi:ADP-ribosylglycohydrolase/predicted esterase